ncbi:reverse transcriptase [Orientia tsutsugamushi]|uniref:reverse transcriptase domain-containing protein n=1 Tax=Orientia tsutsugamushi TaxID=784 RepID=UPI0005F98F46|nr:reverse transcriptase domain-containing protein [Orientia tsutsugamushi]KJV70279.1 reverse transcriptase family protein [Orientia tsutsugamushi str. TA763]KJV71686.1 reverse transcriptase family protein [Orientia tsutsugamushi str. TA763]SPP25461.1 reverse transcriptase [Orientia tsutsugamushi]
MAVHSIDRNTWLTKLERIKLLSSKNQDIKFNNLGYIIDLKMLEEQYKELDSNKAIGIDGITKEDYGKKLKANLLSLLTRIRKGQYQAKPARITEIPKEDGGKRPLVISCFEDKIIESTVSKILNSVFEPIFLKYSYGFRPKLNAHDALRKLNRLTYNFNKGAIVEIDITKCFNTIKHCELMEFLRKRISDKKFLRLVMKLIETPIIENGTIVTNKEGCRQGSIVSPILANVFLHYVIDSWFAKISKENLMGQTGMVRYCDDMVFVFEKETDAKRFYDVLPKRLNKYGLNINEAKSQMIKSGRDHAANLAKQGKKIASYNFLGFTCYWGKSRFGTTWRLKYTSRRDRFTEKLKGLRKYLRGQLNTQDKTQTLSQVIRVIRGWINYHGISDNKRRVSSFINQSKRAIYNWFNRMGGKRKVNWKRLTEILKRINFPKIGKIISMF